MSVIVDDTKEVKSLTDQIADLLTYMAGLEKDYTDKTVQSEVEKFTADLGKTRDDLKALVTSLDSLDFKEDGQIDAKVITAKVAQNEALVNVNKDEVEKIKAQIINLVEKFSAFGEKEEADIKTIQDKLSEVIVSINDFTTKLQNGDFGDAAKTEAKIDDLEKKVTNLESKVSDQDKEISKLQLDVDSIKKQLKANLF